MAKVQFAFIWRESDAEYEFNEGSIFEEKIHDELNDRLATWFANYGPEMLVELSYPSNWKLLDSALTSFIEDEDLPAHIKLYKDDSFVGPFSKAINSYDQMFVTVGDPEDWFGLSQAGQAEAIGLDEGDDDGSYVVSGSFGSVVFDVYSTAVQEIEMSLEALSVIEALEVVKTQILQFFKNIDEKGWDDVFLDENVTIISCPSAIDVFSLKEFGLDKELLNL